MRLVVVAPAAALLLLVTLPAAAAPGRADDAILVEPSRGRRIAAAGPTVIYLNRCAGGCTVADGDNDVRADTSSIVEGTLSPFQYSDAIWDAVVACVADTYAPYDVDIVTEEPASGDYVEVMVAGEPGELGQESNTLGIAPMATDCSAQTNWIAFAFANIHGTDPVIELCATVAHEAGHVFGLEHAYECKDAMTYLQGCGHKFFPNILAPCGRQEPEDCRCAGEAGQNSHRHLRDALGEGATPAAPEVSIPYPEDGAVFDDAFTLFGEVVEPRLVNRVEFWLNGFPWDRVAGARPDGAEDTTTYSYRPTGLPDGVFDVEVRAYNDVGLSGAASVTITKGAPCAGDSSCLDGQACEDGRCAWPPPTVELGGACAAPQECTTFDCTAFDGDQLCSQLCTPADPESCPSDYTCVTTGEEGRCWPSELLGGGGGCCQSGGGPAGPGALVAVTLLGLAGVTRRRRRRRR